MALTFDRGPAGLDVLRDGVGHAGLLRHVLQFILGRWVTAGTLVGPQIFDKPLELGAGRLDLGRTGLLGGQEQRVADRPE